MWKLFLKALPLALIFSFLSSFFIVGKSPFFIRLTLLCFICFMLLLPFLLKIKVFQSGKAYYFFSSLTGLCSGMTGLGGGMIFSSYLFESSKTPVSKTPALVSILMLSVALSSLFFQQRLSGLSFLEDKNWLFYYLLLVIPSLLGIVLGFFFHLRQKNRNLRRWILRGLLVIIFIKLFLELF